MISQNVVPRGAQRPRISHLPPNQLSSSGREAVELAASAGLVLDDWQAWILDHALSEDADGKWSAFEVAVVVGRQNGKGAVLEALELANLFLFDARLIVHSAHEFKTAREHYIRMRSLIEGCDELRERVEYFHISNADQSIGLRSGARLNFVARSRGSTRGFSGDLVVLDEAFKLSTDALGAMLPTLSARPNPQVWYTSSAPHADSHVLHAVRSRALNGDAGRLFYAEWGNEPGTDPNDWDAIAAANPGLCIRISPEHIEAEFAALGHLGDEFARERLGIPSLEDSTAGVFGPGTWQACADPDSTIDGPPTLALDVAPGMTFASFAAAGNRKDGLPHVELIERRPGTGWIVARALELTKRWQRPLVIDPSGPAGGILAELRQHDVNVTEIPPGEFPKACAALQREVANGTFRHLGQLPLNEAVHGAAIRLAGDAWRWSRSNSTVDISSLVAATAAFWGLTHKKPTMLMSAWV